MKRQQVDRIMRVKEMRRKIAEVEAAKANRIVSESESLLASAIANEAYTKQTSVKRREDRLAKLLEDRDNPAYENARIVNVYNMTESEIVESQALTKQREEELSQARYNAKLKQQELAKFLQQENRTEKIRDKLKEAEIEEAIRHE